MAGSDASIYGLLKPVAPPPDPLAQYGQAMQLRTMMGQQELQGLQTQQARRGMDREQRLSDLFAAGKPTTEQIMAIDPKTGIAYAKSQLESQKLQSGIDKDKLDTTIKHLEYGATILGTAKDQPSYDMALKVMAEKFGPDAVAKMPQQFDPQYVATSIQGGLTKAQELADARAKATAAQTAATAPFTPGVNGPVPNQAVQDFQLRKAKSSAPNVSVKVDQKTGESLAKPIGEMVQGTKDTALAALDQLDAAKRISTALDSGKVIVGPGADARLGLAQLGQVLGVGGKSTEETLVNTRNIIKGLAEFTLSARKQLKGQGQVSDFESKLIEKASSGDVSSMTIPEIKTLVGVSDRLARKSYALHEKNLETLRSSEHGGLAPYYEIPPLPKNETTSPPKPKLGARVDGYIFKGGDPADQKNWEKER